MAPIKYNNTTKEAIANYYKQGFSMSECSKKFKVSKPSIRLWLKEMGINRTPKEGTLLRINKGIGRRENHPNWKGGTWIDSRGYAWINHGTVNKVKNEKSMHRYVAEKVLGRILTSDECVHHINGIKTDNRNCNLLICSNAYHNFLNNWMASLYMKEHFSN